MHRGSDSCFTKKINGAARKTLLVDLDAFVAYVDKLGLLHIGRIVAKLK